MLRRRYLNEEAQLRTEKYKVGVSNDPPKGQVDCVVCSGYIRKNSGDQSVV
jgi:hypothetical protein